MTAIESTRDHGHVPTVTAIESTRDHGHVPVVNTVTSNVTAITFHRDRDRFPP